jgi:hypothetical protein
LHVAAHQLASCFRGVPGAVLLQHHPSNGCEVPADSAQS